MGVDCVPRPAFCRTLFEHVTFMSDVWSEPCEDMLWLTHTLQSCLRAASRSPQSLHLSLHTSCQTLEHAVRTMHIVTAKSHSRAKPVVAPVCRSLSRLPGSCKGR